MTLIQSDLLFPHRSTAALEGLCDDEWDTLVQRVSVQPKMHVDSLAFSLMMVYLCECTNCQMGCYKASLGCTVCAQRAVANDGDLPGRVREHFESARAQVVAYLESDDGERWKR